MQLTEIRDWFSYTKTFTFTATGQVLPDTIPIQADADFVLVKIMHTSSVDVNTQNIVDGGALITIKDQADGRDLMDSAVPLDSISGRGQLPFILPYPHRFKRNNSIAITLTNRAASNQVIRLTFSGYKTWPVQGA
jgi:hypothetical protein